MCFPDLMISIFLGIPPPTHPHGASSQPQGVSAPRDNVPVSESEQLDSQAPTSPYDAQQYYRQFAPQVSV